MNEELIKTGDFAKMCAVTKKALYVYEAKGLLFSLQLVHFWLITTIFVVSIWFVSEQILISCWIEKTMKVFLF